MEVISGGKSTDDITASSCSLRIMRTGKCSQCMTKKVDCFQISQTKTNRFQYRTNFFPLVWRKYEYEIS